MSTGQEVALHAVRTENRTAAEAVSWFAENTAPDWQAIGYTLSARAATWVRVGHDGAIETGGAENDPLSEAYEMVLFDGERELRWLRGEGGRGPAIALGEEPSDLPHGESVTADPPPRRGDTHTRLLAGTPEEHSADWTALRGERYATAYLPVAFENGDTLVIETVEYLGEDEHGNVDVVDTRTIKLRATSSKAVRAVPSATIRGEEVTA